MKKYKTKRHVYAIPDKNNLHERVKKACVGLSVTMIAFIGEALEKHLNEVEKK